MLIKHMATITLKYISRNLQPKKDAVRNAIYNRARKFTSAFTDVSSSIAFWKMNSMHEHSNQKMNFESDSFLPFIRHNPNIAAAEATYINFDPEYISNGFPLSEIAKNITMYSNIEILPMLSIDLDILLFLNL